MKKNAPSDSNSGSLFLLVFFLSLLLGNFLPLLGPFLVASLFPFLKNSVLEEEDLVVEPKMIIRIIVLAELVCFVGLELFLVYIADLISFNNFTLWVAVGFVLNSLFAYLGFLCREMWNRLGSILTNLKSTYNHGS